MTMRKMISQFKTIFGRKSVSHKPRDIVPSAIVCMSSSIRKSLKRVPFTQESLGIAEKHLLGGKKRHPIINYLSRQGN